MLGVRRTFYVVGIVRECRCLYDYILQYVPPPKSDVSPVMSSKFVHHFFLEMDRVKATWWMIKLGDVMRVIAGQL